jgi:hypothetical protein
MPPNSLILTPLPTDIIPFNASFCLKSRIDLRLASTECNNRKVLKIKLVPVATSVEARGAMAGGDAMAELIADPHLRLHLQSAADGLHQHPSSTLQQARSLILDALNVASSALSSSLRTTERLLLSLPATRRCPTSSPPTPPTLRPGARAGSKDQLSSAVAWICPPDTGGR